MSYQTLNPFKAQFTFPVKTESFSYDSKEYRNLVDLAFSLYENKAFTHCKVKLTATTLATFSMGVLELAEKGYKLDANERSTSAGNGSYGLNFLKPASMVAEDKEFISKMVQDAYLAEVEVNANILKAKLKANVLAEEKQKENEKALAQQAKVEAAATKRAEIEYEQLLKQFEEAEQ
ncbi:MULTISPECIES: hypothetical protein [Pseudomonas]|uniref:hypothetical protein n=1 Tax=Pseudomonas TaxID=286 RepID=UPI000372665F|nr:MULTISPECIES: hypothetical protein [Pseudomonas]MDC7829802.1 hypothetical protein [Pseudomonas benzopyrenica]